MVWPFSRTARVVAKPFDFAANRYQARSVWPPRFENLSTKEKFRLERTFRRRNKLKWARPTWNKVLVLTQWGLISTVVAYAALYMDWGATQTEHEDNMPQVIKNIRQWYFNAADGVINTVWGEGSSMGTQSAHFALMERRLLEEEKLREESKR